MLGTTVKSIQLSLFDSSTLNGTLQVINTDGLPETCFYIRIVNDSGQSITLSMDGSSDSEYIIARGMWELNAQQNARPSAEMCNFAKGQKFYVTGTASAGTITLSGYYV